MNLDLTIHRMAFREAPTLGEAQVLVAKKHAELESELILKQANDGTAATPGVVERAVAEMQAVSDGRVKAQAHQLDRLA
jgi:hypothetical protein